MHKELEWYAVRTRPRWEKKVADLLSKKEIEPYCPLNKIMRQWSDRKKLVSEPLFTGYVFIRSTEAQHLKVKQTDGVINIVCWNNKPAIIKDEEIKEIRKFLAGHENVQIERNKVSMNDAVKIIHGPLLHLEGNVLEVRTNSIKVLLPSLGYTLVASSKNFEKILV